MACGRAPAHGREMAEVLKMMQGCERPSYDAIAAPEPALSPCSMGHRAGSTMAEMVATAVNSSDMVADSALQ